MMTDADKLTLRGEISRVRGCIGDWITEKGADEVDCTSSRITAGVCLAERALKRMKEIEISTSRL